jgi:hypothetical protein
MQVFFIRHGDGDFCIFAKLRRKKKSKIKKIMLKIGKPARHWREFGRMHVCVAAA